MAQRLSDFPLIDEIKEEYIMLRDELQRKKAVQALMREYGNELADSDDAVLFWLGIAAGQAELGELTAECREKVLTSISAANNDELVFAEGELDFLNEKSSGKKRTAQSYWTWKPGDVYLYDLNSDYAKEAHIDDCSLLLYVVDYEAIARHRYPIVYLLLWLGKDAPQSCEEIESCGYLELDKPFWKSKSEGKRACRKLFFCKSKTEFEAFAAKLKYIGNYSELKAPERQATFDEYAMFTAPEYVERAACRAFMRGDIHYLVEDET